MAAEGRGAMISQPPLPSLVVAPEVNLKPWKDGVFSDFSIGRWKPKAARAGAFEALVPLSDAEQDRCTSPVDLAFTFLRAGRLEPAGLVEALARALARFLPVAGRFVRRDIQPEGYPGKALRLCILCNNAGVAFRATSADGKLPPTVGLLPPKLFDRALATEPTQAGGFGGPLLRVQLVDFEDGQLLALSFVKGLADAVGLGHFLQCWAALYRGEEVARTPYPVLDRVALELLHTWPQPRLQSSFVRIHHPEQVDPGVAVRGELVLSVLFRSEELQSMVQSTSEHCRKKFLIYDSETLSEAEVVLATVAEAMHSSSLAACMPFDYRETYGFERLFGHAHALIDLKLPRDLFNTASALRKLPKIAESRDFWSWKVAQPQHSLEGRLVLDSWLQGIRLEELRFGEALPVGANLSSAFWQESVADPAGCGSCQALLLPHAEGVLLQALLPRQAVNRLSAGRIFATWQP